ncbi:hypothetical protein TIFTF001_051929 [Ficus carica]|uniref:Uncharacterized protein n=1 Tax=Ficus carica TaxID=3494 RepID=A0AA88EDT1_FICCA|nr:hypothetical protein TIFTF001_051929 [Ficus carica]
MHVKVVWPSQLRVFCLIASFPTLKRNGPRSKIRNRILAPSKSHSETSEHQPLTVLPHFQLSNFPHTLYSQHLKLGMSESCPPSSPPLMMSSASSSQPITSLLSSSPPA